MKGYAYAGAGRRIVRVDVSADAGENWHQAELVAGTDQKPGRAWAWVLWEATVSPTLLGSPKFVALTLCKWVCRLIQKLVPLANRGLL